MDIARYGGASAAAPRVAAHFARHIDAAQREGRAVAPAPSFAAIEKIIDAAFWASLRREEGYMPRISLAYLPPEQSRRPLLFERPIPLVPAFLARVAPADERASSLPDCPPLLTSLLGFEAPASWADSVNVLVQLAASMRAHGRGGALLVVPSGTTTWRESIVRPILYSVQPYFSELTDLMNNPATE